MNDDTTPDEGNRQPRETESTDRLPSLVAEIVIPRDGPAECTLFSPDVTGFERTTTWITAEEGSFVSLAKMT